MILITYNKYSGKRYEREMLRRTKTTITVKREDWLTGEMKLTFRPTSGLYANDYAAETYKEQGQ